MAHAIPSYLNRLFEVFQDEGFDPRKDTKLHTFVIGAEPHTEEQRQRIEEIIGVKAYNSFDLSEMNGPGVAFECTYQNGLHIWEDAFLIEIIVKGCNVFPMQIEGVLMKISEVGVDYLITLDTINRSDEMIIEVEVKKDWFKCMVSKQPN